MEEIVCVVCKSVQSKDGTLISKSNLAAEKDTAQNRVKELEGQIEEAKKAKQKGKDDESIWSIFG